MDYIEFLRARRALVIFAIVIFAIAAIVVASVHFALGTVSSNGTSIVIDSSHPHGIGATHEHSFGPIYLDVIFDGAAFCAIVFGSVLASSLNRANAYANFVFTKPISRERLALRFMSLDAAAIALSFAIACVVALAAIASLGFANLLTSGPLSIWVAACGLGVAFLWFGLLQAITAPLPGGGGVIVGISWPVFLGLLPLPLFKALGPMVTSLATALDFLNPLYYMPNVTQESHRGISIDTATGLALPLQTAIVWALALVACTSATRIWRRFEG